MINSSRFIPASIASAALLAGITVAPWGGSPSAHYAAASAASPAVAVSVQHRHGPSQAVRNWYNNGGKAKVAAVGNVLNKLSTDSQTFFNDASSGASTTNDLNTLALDGGMLTSSATALLKDLPPGASRSAVAAGCHQLQQAASDIGDGIALYDSGDKSGSATQFNNAGTALSTAGNDISSATAIISNGR